MVDADEFLMSFTAAGSIPGLGTVDDSDIVKFTSTSLGTTTAGTFSWYFDGSDVGLTTNDEDVDAIELLSSGELVISTTGSFSVTGAGSGVGQDLIKFTPMGTTGVGDDSTAGNWTFYFDGSDSAAGLTSSNENLDAVAVDGTGKILLSTTGSFSVPGVSGGDEDLFKFRSNAATGFKHDRHLRIHIVLRQLRVRHASKCFPPMAQLKTIYWQSCLVGTPIPAACHTPSGTPWNLNRSGPQLSWCWRMSSVPRFNGSMALQQIFT